MNKFFHIAVFLAAAFFLSACTYKLAGTAQPLPFKTIAVKQVENNSYAPQASSPLTTQLALRLSQSPAVELASIEKADVILEVSLDDYTRRMIASRADDTALASGVNIRLRATCTLRDRTSGKILFENVPIEVNSNIYDRGDGLINPEFQNMTTLTGELSKRIAEQVLGIW